MARGKISGIFDAPRHLMGRRCRLWRWLGSGVGLRCIGFRGREGRRCHRGQLLRLIGRFCLGRGRFGFGGFVSDRGVSAFAAWSAGGGSPLGLSTSLASGSPRSSDARRPRGGGAGGLGCGCGGAGAAFGGGSSTSCTGIGSTSAGGDIGQSIRSNRGSRCNMSEPTGPRSLLQRCCSLAGRVRSSSRPKRGSIDPWATASAGATKEITGSRSLSTGAAAGPKAGSRRSSSEGRNTGRGYPAASPASASQAASSSNVTPSAADFVAFEPGSVPATT